MDSPLTGRSPPRRGQGAHGEPDHQREKTRLEMATSNTESRPASEERPSSSLTPGVARIVAAQELRQSLLSGSKRLPVRGFEALAHGLRRHAQPIGGLALARAPADQLDRRHQRGGLGLFVLPTPEAN